MRKITLITGAGRGIGFGIAEKFAQNDNDLILIIRNKKQINNLKNIEKKYSIKVKIMVGDLRKTSFINKLKKIPKINNLINNAAGENTKFFTNVSKNELDDMIKVNLSANFQISQIFAKKMIKNKIKGCIIGLSSQLAHVSIQ